MRSTRGVIAIAAAMSLLLLCCADGSEDDAVDATVDVEEVAVAETGDDAPDADDDSCGGEAVPTDEERAVIEDYVEAWNAQDVDAIVALTGGGAAAEHARCEHEAVLSADVTLTVDLDACRTTFADATGQTISTTMDATGDWLDKFDIGPLSERDDGPVLLNSMIPHEMLWLGVLDDAATEAFWNCGQCGGCDELYSSTQRALIDDYVDAFNTRDLDAVMVLIWREQPDEGPWSWSTPEQARCEHEALFAADVTLSVDFDECSLEFSDATGQPLAPSIGPCLQGWFPFLDFAGACATE